MLRAITEDDLETEEGRRDEASTVRFAKWVRTTVVEGIKNTIQATFYAWHYSTKPNMTCAPLLVAVRDGIQRLEEQLSQEAEEATTAEVSTEPSQKKRVTCDQDEEEDRGLDI